MKKNLFRIACLWLCLALCAPALAEGVDYSLAEKLSKQLEAGSGFTGTLTVSSEAVPGRESDAYTTIKPFTFDCTYLYTREDAATRTAAERRCGLVLKDGENAQATLDVALRGSQVFFQSDLIGADWYSLSREDDTVAGAGQSALNATAMPSLAGFAADLLLNLQGKSTADLQEPLDSYLTKVDLWIEGYRQNAVLGKLDDGTATMEVNYSIPPAAVKAQIKQLVLDLLNDEAVLAGLKALLTDEQAAQLLDARQQNYYFYAVDELPLSGDLSISRTVSLKGDTVALHMSLPLIDQTAGALTLTYDRTAGTGDLPDENVIRLESAKVLVEIAYQKYSSMTGVNVYQGTVVRDPQGADAYVVDSSEGAAKTFSAAFTLTNREENGVNDEGKNTLSYSVQLSVAPDYTPADREDEAQPPTDAQQAQYVVFQPLDFSLSAVFSSGQAKNASTGVDLTLEISGVELPDKITLAFSGKSTSKWSLSAVNASRAVALSSLTQEQRDQLIAQAGVKAGLLVLPYVGLPQTAAAAPQGETVPADTAEPTSTATTEPTSTASTEPTDTPAPSASPETSASPAPSATPQGSAAPIPTHTATPEATDHAQ